MDIILEENPNPFTRNQNNQPDDLESEQLLPETTEDGHLNAALEDTADTATPFLAPEVSGSEKKRGFETLTYPGIAGEIDSVENPPEGHPHFDTAPERQSDVNSISQGHSLHADDTPDRWNACDSDTEGVGGILRQGQNDRGAVVQPRCSEIPHRDDSIRLGVDSSRVTNYRIPNSATCENCCKCCGNKQRVSSCQVQMAGAGEAFSAKSTENGGTSRGGVFGPQSCSCFSDPAANQPEVNGHCSPDRVRYCLAANTRETERPGMCLLKEFPQSGWVSKVAGPDRLARCDNQNDCAEADNCFSSPVVPDCPVAQGPLDDRPGAMPTSAQSHRLDLDSMSRLKTDRMRREFPEQKTTSNSSPGGSQGSRLGNIANISDQSDIKCAAINGDRQPSKPICSRPEEGSYVERDGKSAGGSALGTHWRHGGPGPTQSDSESRHLSSSDSSSSSDNDATAPACRKSSPPSECGHGDKSMFIVDHLEASSDYSIATVSSSGKDSGCQSQTPVFDMGECHSPSQSPRVKESSFIVQPGSNVTDPLSSDSCKEWPQRCQDCPFCELKLGKNEINLDVLRLTPSLGSNQDTSTSCDKISIPSCSPKKKGPDGNSDPEHPGNFSVSSVTFQTDMTIPNPAQVVFDALKHNLDTDRVAKRKLRQQQAHLEESPVRQCQHTGEDQDIGSKGLGDIHNFEASMDNADTSLPRDRTPRSFPTLEEQVTSDGAVPLAPSNVTDAGTLANSKQEGDISAKDEVHCRCRHEKSLAPPLDDQWLYHIFFLYHHGDHPWVLDLVRQLESPKLDFKCCCLWREMSHASSVLQMAAFGLRNSRKTVIIASPDFISELWYCSDPHVLTETDIARRHRDIIVLDRFSCDLPRSLADLTYIDFRGADWWNRLLMQVTYREEPRVVSQERNHISVTLGPTAGLQSGYLLVSLKSRYDCCGKEVVDPTKVPSDLIGYGVQISEDDYKEAVSCLMSDPKFRCHVWCYNVPAAIVFFALLLGACLAVIPLMESELILHSKDTGVEFVHAGIIWLCVLTAYLFAMHIAKKRMKSSTYSKLTQMNSVLVKYNLLAGVENLGLADCNKYYLHLFYFEMGPCMAYLQELMLGLDESTVAVETPSANHTASSENEQRSNRLSGTDVDHVITGSDQSQVLEATQMTNAAMQTGAEALLLAKSGEYLSQLITKKLAHPHTTRHVQNAVCLCQYVEQNIFKLPV